MRLRVSMTAASRGRSSLNGPPGARRIRKKDSVTMMKRVGIAVSRRRKMKESTERSPQLEALGRTPATTAGEDPTKLGRPRSRGRPVARSAYCLMDRYFEGYTPRVFWWKPSTFDETRFLVP